MTTSPRTPGEFPHHRDPASGAPRSGLPRYAGAADPYAQHSAPAPPEVGRLLKLTVASAGLYVLNAIVSLIATASTDLTSAYQRLGMPAAQARTMAEQAGGSSMITSLITLVIALGLYGLVYTGLKKGKNWARILGIVLAILSGIGAVAGFFGSSIFGSWAIVLIALGVAVLVVDILWLVTAFKKPVAHWFAQRS